MALSEDQTTNRFPSTAIIGLDERRVRSSSAQSPPLVFIFKGVLHFLPALVEVDRMMFEAQVVVSEPDLFDSVHVTMSSSFLGLNPAAIAYCSLPGAGAITTASLQVFPSSVELWAKISPFLA